MLEFNDQTAREAIESGKPVVIDFWATWCGPCIKLGPIVEELAEKYGDQVTVGKLNIDDNDEIASENRVRNI
ncbi:MAG: redoxin family protein, partial [Muribaculaceae bacterium]|nr:redoxin family protein [Muribaculaceae bacterium]